MKFNFSSAILALALLCLSTGIQAQFQYPYVENFGAPNEAYLAAPYSAEGTLLLPVGTDLYEGNDVNTIYYGMTPPNSSSKPVLVFVHGYASSASVWFEGKDNMYHDVYQDGYRAAFVSLTPNRHMWTNGFMLSNMIDVITQHYGVSSVKVIGWSKGGVDTDAALVHFGANTKVSEAFTLSSPHQGTGIAELANNILLSLVNIIFMQNNDATKSLTRGYMSYYRSLTDGLPSNNTDFTTFGAWGNGPLNRLSVPQGYLYLAGGSKASGGNDGVVPYNSSTRPGGRELFDGQRKEYGWFGIPYYPGPSETELDHFEVTRGDLVWPYIKGVFEGTLRTPAPEAPLALNPNRTVSSRMQLVASAGGAETFSVSQAGTVRLFVVRAGADGPLSVESLDGTAAPKLEEIKAESPDAGKWYEMQAAPGEYRLVGEGVFAAMIEEEEGMEALLEMGFSGTERVFKAADQVNAELRLDGEMPAGMQVTGTLQRLHDLEFNAVSDAPEAIRFEAVDGGFRFAGAAGLAPGIYAINVNAVGKQFRRTLSTTFAVTGPATAKTSTPTLTLRAYPNPFTDRLTIELGEDAAELIIFNVFGQEVRRMDVSGKTQAVWKPQADGASAGIYILEQKSKDGRKVSEKVILQ